MRFAAPLLLIAPLAQAAEPAPAFGRYLPLYPGLYADAGFTVDAGDRAFTQSGARADSATPGDGIDVKFPQTRAQVDFTWTFPMFESRDLPFFSDRLHTLRIALPYLQSQAKGLSGGAGSGIGDARLEFGSFLYGSQDWRTRPDTPLAVLLLAGISVPTGSYDPDAPVNAGDNHYAWSATLGAHWRPWSGGFVEAGAGYRWNERNHEPAYGALAPAREGDVQLYDFSFTQRVLPNLYAGLFFADREGARDLYVNPRAAPNAPVPPGGASNAPVAGRYHDDGTALRRLGLQLHGFLTQRWMLSASYAHPLAGKSGEFSLPFENRTPAGCIPGALTCAVSAGGTVREDGLGAARVFASDSFGLSLTYSFGQGDAYTCVGCRR